MPRRASPAWGGERLTQDYTVYYTLLAMERAGAEEGLPHWNTRKTELLAANPSHGFLSGCGVRQVPFAFLWPSACKPTMRDCTD